VSCVLCCHTRVSQLLVATTDAKSHASLASWHFRCIFSSVVADATVVEMTAFENKDSKGRIRIQAYMTKVLGMITGSLLATFLSKGHGLSIQEYFLIQVFPYIRYRLFAVCYYHYPFFVTGIAAFGNNHTWDIFHGGSPSQDNQRKYSKRQ
jgi:hypothetical protein